MEPAPSSVSSTAASAKSRRPSKNSKKSRKGSVAGTDLSAISEGGTISSAQWAQAPSATAAFGISQAQTGVRFDPSVLDAASSLSGAQAGAGRAYQYSSQPSNVSLDALGLSIADTGAAMEQSQAGGSSMFASQTLTLDALGLSLADTGAAMEADSEVGALTLQSLGLTTDDLQEEQTVDAPEDIAERMSRILSTFGTNVGATADFVLVSDAMEPAASYVQPPAASGTPRDQYVAESSPRQTAPPPRRQREEAAMEQLEARMLGGPAQSFSVSSGAPARELALAPLARTQAPSAARSSAPPPPAAAAAAPPPASPAPAGGPREITLDDLGLDLGDLAGGQDNIDDSVLHLAQQLAEENESPRR